MKQPTNQPPVTQPPASLDRLSRLMDSSIRLPGGYRIGWDGIIGLIPGIGDMAGLAISLYILNGAYKAGASTATMLRMIFNVTIEFIVGAVPIVGDIFDFTYKANNRNMQLLRQQFSDPKTIEAQSQRRIWLVGLALLLVVSLMAYATIAVIVRFARWLF